MKSHLSKLRPLKWLATHPVTRSHPVRTFARWTYWQFRERITSRPMTVRFVGDSRLQIVPHGGLTGCWYVGLPEYEEMVFLLRLLRPSDLFFDVGANAGAFAVLAASTGCSVVAFEPIPQPFNELKSNADLNRLNGRISVVNRALGAASGKLRMTTNFGTGNHVCRDGETSPSMEVEVNTLDAYAGEHGMPTFIKIDVEGHELEVIRGARSALANPALIGLLVETFRSHNYDTPKLQDLERTLGEFGFWPFIYAPKSNSLRQIQRTNEGPNNTLYLRDTAAVQVRLQSSNRDLRQWGIHSS